MHDLIDAYAQAVKEATERAQLRRAEAQRLYDEALDHIAADFQVDAVAAGTALEAGVSVRIRILHGEVQVQEAYGDPPPETPPETSALEIGAEEFQAMTRRRDTEQGEDE